MPKSLLEQLPDIVANGRKQAEKILEGIESRHRVGLQTREVVLPARDTKAQDWIAQQNRASQREVFAPGQASLIDDPQATLGAAPEAPWVNRLIYGDNLLAMAAFATWNLSNGFSDYLRERDRYLFASTVSYHRRVLHRDLWCVRYRHACSRACL